MDEKVLVKIKDLITARQRIDRELEALIGGEPAKRGRRRITHGSTTTIGRSWSVGETRIEPDSNNEGEIGGK